MKVSELSDKEWKLIYKHLRLQARKFTFTNEDAEDLASDAFTKGYGKIDSFNPPDGDGDRKLRALKGWFNKIMKNLYVDKVKSADNQRVDRGFEIKDEITKSSIDKPETIVVQEDLKTKLFQLCKEILSPREYEILLLNMEGLKYREIADQLGIATNSVGAKISNAKLKLAGEIEHFEALI